MNNFRLPSADLIGYFELSTAIARYDHPGASSLPGVACIAGKRYFLPHVDLYSTTEPLTEEDKVLLGSLMKQLPHLHDQMTSDDVMGFLTVFRDLTGRPDWEPDIPTVTQRRRIKDDQDQARNDHIEQLADEVLAGRIQLVDRRRMLMNRVGPGACLTREQALAYLARIGIKVCSDAVPSTTQTPPIAQKAKADSPWATKLWTPDKLEELRASRDKNGTKAAAREFGISESRIRQLLPHKSDATPVEWQLER